MIVKPDALTPLPTDKYFDDSPDAGHKDCICSRCASQIIHGEHPIRMFTTNSLGEVDEKSKELRLCQLCVSGEKYFYCETHVEMGFQCKEQCNKCKQDYETEKYFL